MYLRTVLALLFICVSAHASTNLVLIGGGPKPSRALEIFSKLALQNPNPNILVISWGTSDPQGAFEDFKKDISNYFPAQKVFAAQPFEQMPKNKEMFLTLLNNSSALFFTGGDQNKVMKVILDLNLKERLIQKFNEGTVFGGTSAGTAIMSNPMMAGGEDPTVINASKVPVAQGLGLLQGYILDMHFVKRMRQNRLMSLVLAYPQYKGLGIDEGAAVHIQNGLVQEVIGGISLVYTATPKKNTLITEVLTPKSYKALR